MGKRKAPSDSATSANQEIVNMLLELAEYEKNVNRHIFKYQAYRKAAHAIEQHDEAVTSGAEARQLPGVGAKIAEKIEEFLRTGKLRKLEDVRKDADNSAIQDLVRVSGVGPAAAQKLVKDGITSVEELKKHTEKLNHHQMLGLKYLADFEQRIPRAEVAKLRNLVVEAVHAVDTRYTAEACGSFRRGAATSGDLDVLVAHPDYSTKTNTSKKHTSHLADIVKELEKRGIVTETISLGEAKFMGVCVLPRKSRAPDTKRAIHRRIDIRLIPHDEYYCGLLYFTGSDQFNRQMRAKALQEGFTLNEYTIRPVGSTGQPGESLPVTSERDVFEYLGMEYKPPEERNF